MKNLLKPLVDNEGTDQPANSCSLIIAFAVNYLFSSITKFKTLALN